MKTELEIQNRINEINKSLKWITELEMLSLSRSDTYKELCLKIDILEWILYDKK